MQAAEVGAKCRFTVTLNLGSVDADGKAGGGGVVVNADDSAAVEQEIFENGKVCLLELASVWRKESQGAYLVVNLAPCLVLKAVMLQSL